MLKPQHKGPIFIALAAICWSFGGLGIRLIPWGALSIAGMRSLLAAVAFAIFRRSVKIEFTTGNILAAICLTLTTTLFIFANQLTTVAAAVLLQFSMPVFVVLMQLIFYKKKPRTGDTIAVLVTVAGMTLFFLEQLEAGGLLGNIISIISGATFAGVFVCNRRPDTKPDQAIFLGLIGTAVIGLPFFFFDVTPDPVAWASILFLGIVQVGIAYVFFSIGIARTPALLACIVAAVEPILGPIWVAIVIGEIPGPLTIMGGIVIVVTVVSYNIWVEKRSRITPEAEML